MSGKHVRPKREKKPKESKTKPFKPVILLEYKDFSGYWEYTVIFPYMITWSGYYNRKQTWREAREDAIEAWNRHKPTDPVPEVVVCYTYEQYRDAYTKAGWR